MSEKLTREQIEKWREFFETVSWLALDMPHLNALCDLTLAGLEVQPRPIEDAPKDEWLLIFGRHSRRTGCNVLTAKYDGEEWESGDDGQRPYMNEPTHFIPLTSLPEPK